jgi:hypothetical protein
MLGFTGRINSLLAIVGYFQRPSLVSTVNPRGWRTFHMMDRVACWKEREEKQRAEDRNSGALSPMAAREA